MRTNETNQKITNGQEEFIMKPYVDWCFKELMRNPKTRQGFIAVLLKVPPEEIGETILLKNELSRRSEEEKQGILDVHVLLRNGIQIDMEMQVAYVDYWDERQMFYLCKMFADQLKRVLRQVVYGDALHKNPPFGLIYRMFHFHYSITGGEKNPLLCNSNQ